GRDRLPRLRVDGRVVRPEVFPRREPGVVDLRREVAPEVPVVPRLVAVADDVLLALRVAHQPAELPGVLRQPATRWRCLGHERGGARGRKVDRHAELMLRVTGSGGEVDRLIEAVALRVA